MSIWQEGKELFADLKIPENFDGSVALRHYFRTGKFITFIYEPDMLIVGQESNEFKLDSEALAFLMNKINLKKSDSGSSST